LPPQGHIPPVSRNSGEDGSAASLQIGALWMDGAEAQHILLSMRNNSPWAVYRGTPDCLLVSAGAGAGREAEIPTKGAPRGAGPPPPES